jgi:hypothetical protein
MKKRIARSIGEFDEPKALLRAEPLDDRADRWAGRYLGAGFAEPGSGAECARRWLIDISVELTPA